MKDKFSPKSGFIELAEYDTDANALDLSFKTGSKRRYLGFFKATWESFKQADNHGVYYSRLIKGRFNSVPLDNKSIGRRLKISERTKPHVNRKPGNRFSRPITGSSGTVARAFGFTGKPKQQSGKATA